MIASSLRARQKSRVGRFYAAGADCSIVQRYRHICLHLAFCLPLKNAIALHGCEVWREKSQKMGF